MLVKTYCAAVIGLEATTITIEVNMTRGVMFHLSGLADTTVKESYDRIRAAMSNVGFKPPTADLTINLSPADIRKEGCGYDLPLAIGILAAHNKISDTMLNDYMMVGELGLDGKLKPVSGALPIAIRARKEHFKGLIVPKENVREAAVVNDLDVYGMENLIDVISFFNGSDNYEPTFVDTRKEFYEQQYSFDLDFADVKGQEGVKRAHISGGVPCMEISADKLDEENLGALIYFFEAACGISGYMEGVNPFDQPGVEEYKKNMFALLGKK